MHTNCRKDREGIGIPRTLDSANEQMPRIRLARHGDGPALLALYQACFTEHGATVRSGVHALYTQDLVVAEIDGDIVGLGAWAGLLDDGMGPEFRTWLSALLPDQRGMYASDDPDAPFRVEAPDDWVVIPAPGDRVFTALAVHPDHRRKGVGTSLALARLALAREAGVRKVFVHCIAGSGSRELYEGLGFVPLVTKRQHYPGGRGMTLLVKPLAG
jgi:N-acetylglutamate synthase-like GNAT family acetyltransferase